MSAVESLIETGKQLEELQKRRPGLSFFTGGSNSNRIKVELHEGQQPRIYSLNFEDSGARIIGSRSIPVTATDSKSCSELVIEKLEQLFDRPQTNIKPLHFVN